MKRILLCDYVNGNTRLTADGAALLIGISADQLVERWNPEDGADRLPPEWKRRGQKRSMHARNATGTNIANVNLGYLAIRDLGARIDFDEKSGQMWAVIDEEGD